MLVYKDRGFVSPDLNETLGITKVELVSTGRNNSSTSSAKVDGSVLTTTTRRGVTVVALNDDWTVFETNRFDTFADNASKDALANYIRNRPSNKIFLFLTFDSIDTNSNLTSAMIGFGSIRYQEIPFSDEYNILEDYTYNTRIPYCAIAGSEVGIVYESLGSGVKEADYPNAEINAILPELKYFGCQGFGRNLTDTIRVRGTSFFSFVMRPMDEPAKQHVKFSYFHKVHNQDGVMSKGGWVRVDLVNHDNDAILDTVYNRYITSKQWSKNTGYLPPLPVDHKYRVSFIADGNSVFEVDRIRLVKCGVEHPMVDDKHFGRITDEYTSALHLRTSMFGMEPYHGDAIQGAFESSTQLFNDNLAIPVYESTDVKGVYINGVYESDMVEVNDVDVGIISNAILYSDVSGFKPRISTKFYDENSTLLDEQVHVEVEYDTLPEDENIFIEWFCFKEADVPEYETYSRYQNVRYGSITLKYGYSIYGDINQVLLIPVGTKFISFEISDVSGLGYYMAFPCSSPITPLIGGDGYISPSNFNMDIPEISTSNALIFENTQYTEYFKKDGTDILEREELNTIYDSETLDVWEYTGSKWELKNDSIFSFITPPRTIENFLTKKTYDLDFEQSTLVSNDGIVGAVPTIELIQNSKNQVTFDKLASLYPYDSLNVKALSEIQNASVDVKPDRLIIDTGENDGYLYMFLEADDNTIGFMRYNFESSIVPVRANGLVFDTIKEVNFFQNEFIPTSNEEILNTWPRSENETFWIDPSNATGNSAQWYYDANSDSFVQPINSNPVLQILSPVTVNNYNIGGYLASNVNDDDAIGLVMAADFIDGEFLSVVAWVESLGQNIAVADQNGENGMNSLKIAFYDNTSENSFGRAHLIDYHDIVSRRGGWATLGQIRMEISRTNSLVTVAIGDWNSNTVREDTRISFDLFDLPRNGYKLADTSRFGFATLSQANSTYLDMDIISSDYENDNVLYSLEDNIRWEYNHSTSTWEISGSPSDDFSDVDTISNTRTKQEYSFSNGSLVFEENNGIYGNVPVLQYAANSTITITDETELTSLYSYDGATPLTIVRVVEDTNCTVTFDPVSETYEITTTGSNGNFYLYLRSPDDTIAFKRYDIEVT